MTTDTQEGEAVARCLRTGNPVGTDTEMIGHPCRCQVCCLTRQLAEAREQAEQNWKMWEDNAAATAAAANRALIAEERLAEAREAIECLLGAFVEGEADATVDQQIHAHDKARCWLSQTAAIGTTNG